MRFAHGKCAGREEVGSGHLAVGRKQKPKAGPLSAYYLLPTTYCLLMFAVD